MQFWSRPDGDAAVTDGAVVPRLFCLPHAGSGAAGFYRWKRELAGVAAVCPVRLPGRESRLMEPALDSILTVVEAMHREILREAPQWFEQPYAIFGHSMSSLTAFEWGRRIAADGLPEPMLLWVSGRNGPRTGASVEAPLHALADEELLRGLEARYGGGERQALMEDEDLRALFLPSLRADLRAIETYRYVAGESVGCPVVATAGGSDASVSDEGLARWREVCDGPFRTKRIPGDHFYPFGAGQAELLAMLRQALR